MCAHLSAVQMLPMIFKNVSHCNARVQATNASPILMTARGMRRRNALALLYSQSPSKLQRYINTSERLCSLSSDFTHWNRYPSSWQSWQQVGSCVTREMHHDNLAEDIDGEDE